MEEVVQFELTREFADRLKEAVDNQDDLFIQESLAGVNPADISETLEEFNAEDSKYVLSVLNKEVGAEVISELEEDTRKKFLRDFEEEEIASYLDEIDSDDGADILNDLPVRIREKVVSSMSNGKDGSYPRSDAVRGRCRRRLDGQGAYQSQPQLDGGPNN